MADVYRVVVPVDTMGDQSWQLAVRYALSMARMTSPPTNDVILLTDTKHQLDPTTQLAADIGESTIDSLANGRKINLSDGVTLRHATLQTLGDLASNTVVIAMHADDKMLEKLEGKNGISAIVAVLNVVGVADLWIQRWNPLVHHVRHQKTKLIDDPVIKEALESITLRSNIAGNVLGPGDKTYANEVFRILRAKGHILEAIPIEAWAIRRGWNPRSADHLSLVAKKIGQLKGKPSLKGIHNPAGRYYLWNN